MKKEELLYIITGTETPQLLNKREYAIIDKCLEIINEKENELQNAIEIINEAQQKTSSQYKSISYKTSNGLTMVRSTPYSWVKEQKETLRGEIEYFYTIYVGGMAEGYNMYCNSSENQLTISSDSETLKFTVSSLEEATKIVHSFVVGMKMEERMKDTIYTKEL